MQGRDELSLTERVTTLEARLEALSEELKTLTKISQPIDEFRWTAESTIPLANTYRLEGQVVPFRWVGPKPALNIALALDTKFDYLLEVEIGGFALTTQREQFKLFVNNSHVPWTRNEPENAYRAEIGLGYLASRTTFKIGVDEAIRPRDFLPGNVDDRLLAFSIVSFGISRFA